MNTRKNYQQMMKYASRLNDVVCIISEACEIDYEDALVKVLDTDIGKSLIHMNPDTLYEQTTDNVLSASKEISANSKEFEGKVTPQTIARIYIRSPKVSRTEQKKITTTFRKEKELIEAQRKLFKSAKSSKKKDGFGRGKGYDDKFKK